MRRVLVLGSSGSGKSTFARRLGERTGLPVTHIDQLFWSPGWVQVETGVYHARLADVVAQERWIIDGNNSSALDWRLPRADAVILFDRSRIACIGRVIKRVLASYGRVRDDMAAGCPERFDFQFLRWIWDFPKQQMPKVHAALSRADAWGRVVILRSDRDSEAYLQRATPADAS